MALDADELRTAIPDDDSPELDAVPRRVVPTRGVCRVCGEAADTERGTYCRQHKPATGRPRDPSPDAGPTAAAAPSRPPGRPSVLETELATQFRMVAMLWSIRDPHCGGVLTAQAPVLAKYWADQAAKSPRIRKVLESTARGGGILGAIGVHAPLVMAVYAHHVAPVIAARQAAARAEAIDVDEPAPNPVAPMPDGNGATAPPETAAPWIIGPDDPRYVPEAGNGGAAFL